MSAFHDNALMGASGQQGYKISRSVRLRSSASAYLNWTPASAGNRKTWTMSMWLKRGALSTYQMPFSCFQSGGGALGWQLNTDNTFDFYQYNSAYQFRLVTTPVFRDPSAWYHFVFVVDTTQATASNRIKVYVNGVQITAFSTATYPTQNTDLIFNYAQNHNIGQYASNNTNYFDGYLTEINFIDGQALTPSSFGETDTTTGVWKPKKYAGTYGTNGFYLNFSDNSSNTATTIGKDYSGNGNNWTPNNISVTAGATYDSMIDVPTLYADGGNGRGNYPVLNPLNADTSGLGTSLTYGNLRATGTTYAATAYSCTFQMPQSGKWYYEVVYSALTSQAYVGIRSYSTGSTDVQYGSSGQKSVAGSSTAYGASWTTGDVIGVAVDRDAGTVTFYKNNASQGAISIPTNSAAFDMAFNSAAPYGSASFDVNFGQRPFSYTPPTGFVALNTQNLPESTIKKGNAYFDAKLYTGNGATQSITGMGFAPDLVWTKSRSSAISHGLFDTVRGAGKALYSNATNAEYDYGTTTAGELYQFTSDGFNLGSSGNFNANGVTNVAWNWKESASAGFDIVTYTGTGANRTVAHGIGVAPSMVIVKRRDTAGYGWIVGNTAIGWGNYLVLNATSASQAASTVWNNTAPTSSVFSLGTDAYMNASGGTYVAYLFAEVAGFSKFGSYTGNGSGSADGPFIFCGFRPRFVMVKRTDSTSSWMIVDSARDTYNMVTRGLYANLSDAEGTGDDFDFTANGFKVRDSGVGNNASGGTYIYAAFAEVPFKVANAR